MLAHVDDGVGAPLGVEPAVEGDVVVGGSEVGRVVDGDSALAEAPRRLHCDQHPAQVEPGEDEVPAVGEDPPGCRPPRLGEVGPGLCRQLREMSLVLVLAPRPGAVAASNRLGLVAGVRHGVGQLCHQGVAVGRHSVDPIAGGGEGTQQLDDRRRGVESHGVAETTALGGIGGEDEADPALAHRRAAQGSQPGGQAGDPIDAVGDGAVGGDGRAEVVAVVNGLLEREGRTDDPAIELGDGDGHRHVEG